MLRTRLYYFRIFSIIDNRLCISRLIIDNQNFNTPLQSGTHHAPHRRNTVSGWRQLGLQCTVPGRCSRRRGRGKTDGRRHCWRCCGGKIKQRVHTIYCIHLTNRPADHHGRLDYLGGLTCISISWRHAACGFSQETAGGRVVSVRPPYSCLTLITRRGNRQTTNVWACNVNSQKFDYRLSGNVIR